MNQEQITQCPLCKGSKVSPISGCVCKTCNGEGSIKIEKKNAIMAIRERLSTRLAEKGIEV